MAVNLLSRTLLATWGILLDAGFWMVVSFVLSGLVKAYVGTHKLREAIGRPGAQGMTQAVGVGALLPMCSCGVIPLGISLYYSGAPLGTTLAFMTATPIINPAAAVLAFGLLGPKVAAVYLAAGLTFPFLIGWLGNRMGGPERQRLKPGPVQVTPDLDGPRRTLRQQLLAGQRWAWVELGPLVSRYVVFGSVLAGLVAALIPPEATQRYLGTTSWAGLLLIGLLSTLLYICAVGHMPLVASLLAAGMSPGAGLLFLMAGAATNLPELIAIHRLIGIRSTLLFSGGLVAAGLAAALAVNAWLLPGYVPPSLESAARLVDVAHLFNVHTHEWVNSGSAALIVMIGVIGVARWAGALARSRLTAVRG